MPARPADDLPLLATLIRRLHLAIRHKVHADLRRAGFDDLTPAHIYVFQTPGPDGARPTELAARTNMTKQAMNHLLTFLEDRGYVERVSAPGDGRGKVVRLTPRGRKVARIVQASARELEGEWLRRLGRSRIESLRTALRDVDALAAELGTGQP
jgi:DNA-binding MarR family transcriptional regulator